VQRQHLPGLGTGDGDRPGQAVTARLREEPGLQGKVVLKLTIAPSGQVTGLTIVSSELKKPDVEERLLARIRTFDFGAKDVNVMVVNYPLDFLPS